MGANEIMIARIKHSGGLIHSCCDVESATLGLSVRISAIYDYEITVTIRDNRRSLKIIIMDF